MNRDENLTNGETYGVACQHIRTEEEANEFLKSLIEYHFRRCGGNKEEIEIDLKNSLSYFAGYYDTKTIRRVNKLFKATHPILGNFL